MRRIVGRMDEFERRYIPELVALSGLSEQAARESMSHFTWVVEGRKCVTEIIYGIPENLAREYAAVLKEKALASNIASTLI
jgi:hypothetical protein